MRMSVFFSLHHTPPATILQYRLQANTGSLLHYRLSLIQSFTKKSQNFAEECKTFSRSKEEGGVLRRERHCVCEELHGWKLYILFSPGGPEGFAGVASKLRSAHLPAVSRVLGSNLGGHPQREFSLS